MVGNYKHVPVQRSSGYLVMDDELFMSAIRKFPVSTHQATSHHNQDHSVLNKQETPLTREEMTVKQLKHPSSYGPLW